MTQAEARSVQPSTAVTLNHSPFLHAISSADSPASVYNHPVGCGQLLGPLFWDAPLSAPTLTKPTAAEYDCGVNVQPPPTRIRKYLAAWRLVLLFMLATVLIYLSPLWLQPARSTFHPLPHAPHPRLDSTLPFLGVTIALEQYATAAERSAALNRLQRAGFGWVRQRLDWGELEPVPGHYDWSQSDALLHSIGATSLLPVIVLDGSPAWARAPQDRQPTANPFAPPANAADFGRFAAAFAQRYGAQINHYQIWDEPNIAPHWGNRLIEPVGYAQLLHVAADAIRTNDPDGANGAVIISAALAPTADRGHTAIDEIYYLQRLYAAGAAANFDRLAIQPFGFGRAPTEPDVANERLNLARVHLIRQTMMAAGDGATPIWAVRYGWNRQLASPWATVSTADQQRFAVAALDHARGHWPWLTAMGWVIDQPAAPPDDPMWGFALTDPLLETFRDWSKAQRISVDEIRPPGAAETEARGLRFWVLGHGAGSMLLLFVGLGGILWRLQAAAAFWPWSRWRAGYRSRRLVQGAVWSTLILIYYFATTLPLLLLCWLSAIILARWQPRVGLGLAVVLIPFYTQHKEIVLATTTLTLPPTQALLLCLGIAQLTRGRALLRVSRKFWQRLLPLSMQDPLSLLAVGWLLINLLAAYNVWHWPAYRSGLWELVLVPLLLLLLVRSNRSEYWLQLLLALFGGGVLLATVGLLTWLRGDGTAVDGFLRLTGPYYSPNQAALYLERTLFVGMGLLFQFRATGALPRGWLLVGLGVTAAALLLTGSRGALLLGVPMGLVLCWWLGWPRRGARFRLVRWLWLSALMVMLLGLLVFGGERLTNSATLLHRLTIWQGAWQLWLDFPWLGVGPGGFFWRYPAYLPLGALDEPNLHHPHNLWLALATGWGVLGLFWLGCSVALLVGSVRAVHRLAPADRGPVIGLLAALGAGLAHGQVDAFLLLPDLALWFWLALALLLAALQAERHVGAVDSG